MAKVNHTTRKHALLSASGSSRWLNCTPSALLEDKHSASHPEKPSVYAQEGTLAHELADVLLRFELGEIPEKIKKAEIRKIEKNPLFTDEMTIEVMKYVNYVKQTIEESEKQGQTFTLIEERLDFSHLVENGFGTGDACIISSDVLNVIDLKYGKGIKVDAQNNTQMMLYASGALHEYELMYDIKIIRMTIVQPRLNHVSVWEISVEDLKKWGEEVVKPKAQIAIKGEGDKKAGPWCKFCKIAALCKTLAEENIKLAQYEFADPHLLSDSELIKIHEQSQMLVDWVNAVSKYILDTAIEGKKWSGYKLVEGRSNRRWGDEEKVIEELKKMKIAQKTFMPPKLLPITAIEKLIGKKDFESRISKYVTKPQGAPTLVFETDPRPALGHEQAKLDFKD